MSAIQTIEVDATKVLDAVKSILPVVEAAVPAAAGAGPEVGLAVTAADGLLQLVNLIPTGTIISIDEQASILARIQKIAQAGFSGPAWQPR